MEKEYIDQILSRLLEMTKKKSIIWNIDSNSQQNYRLSTKTEDGLTKFTAEVSLDEHLNLNGHDMWWIYIYNIELSDGKIAIYSRREPIVNNIIQEIYNLYIKPKVTIVDQSKILNKILNSLDLENIRDEKIGSILNR